MHALTAKPLLAPGSVSGRFAGAAIWSVAGMGLYQVSLLAGSMIAARLLGAEAFGQLGMIQSTSGLLGILAGIGLGLTTTKYVAEFRDTDPVRAGNMVAFGSAVAFVSSTVAGAALFATAPLLAAKVLHAAALETELRISAGLVLFNGLAGVQTGTLAGLERFRSVAVLNAVRGLASFVLVALGALVWGLQGAVWGLLAGSAMAYLIGREAVRRECAAAGIPARLGASAACRRALWEFSIPAFVSNAVASPVAWLGNIMLLSHPGGYSEIGQFVIANNWRIAISFLPTVMCQPLVSLMCNAYGNRSLDTFRRLLSSSLVAGFALSGGAAIAVAAASRQIVACYGPGYSGALPVLLLMAVVAVLSSTASVVGQAIAALGKMWWGAGLNLAWGGVLLGSASLLIPGYGARGLAWAFIISYSWHALSSAFVCFRVLSGLSGEVEPVPVPAIVLSDLR